MTVGRKVWGQIAAICAVIIATGTAVATYDELRPYPNKAEFQQVAGRSCKNEMSLYKAELRVINRDIARAQDEKNTNWERSLREQKQAVLVEIERVKRECGWS